MDDQEILLESGTNEFEILEFYLGNQSYGINSLKVLQIISYDPSQITKAPGSPSSVIGSIFVMDKFTTVIDLKTNIQKKVESPSERRPVLLITEVNSYIHAFLVDGIEQIHRISWDKVQPPSLLLTRSTKALKMTGVACLEDRDVIILDFEIIIGKIEGDIAPSRRSDDRTLSDEQIKKREQRKQIHVMLAEDSMMMRQLVVEKLKAEGYEQLTVFNDGLSLHQAYLTLINKAQQEGKTLKELLHIVITDIEMPRMDGLTLCKKIKDSTPEIPVIILSSMVNEQMALRCEFVGADANVTKQSIYDKLISLMDQICL